MTTPDDADVPSIKITADRARVTQADGRVLYSGPDINRAFAVLDQARKRRWTRLNKKAWAAQPEGAVPPNDRTSEKDARASQARPAGKVGS